MWSFFAHLELFMVYIIFVWFISLLESVNSKCVFCSIKIQYYLSFLINSCLCSCVLITVALQSSFLEPLLLDNFWLYFANCVLGFSGPKTFWSVVTEGMFVKQSIYNRILIDYITNCTPSNVQTKIKLRPWIKWIDHFPGKRKRICYHDSYC